MLTASLMILASFFLIFLDQEGKNILCASHGAVFRIEDGVCTEGPCEGERLIAFPAQIEGGSVFIEV